MRKEWYNTYNIGEKFLICIGMTLLAIRGIVGNVLIDLVFVITFLYERKVLRINSIINLVKEIDVGAIIESLVSFISENGNMMENSLIHRWRKVQKVSWIRQCVFLGKMM